MKKRVFIAINLPEEIKKKIINYQEKIEKSFALIDSEYYAQKFFRWTKKENLHITLVFLGYIKDEQLPEIIELTKKTAEKYQPFSVSLEKIIYGPVNKNIPRMIWIIGKKSEQLSKIKNELENTFSQKISQFKKENKGFVPHITLARIKQWAFRKISPEERPEIAEDFSFDFEVNSMEIMESKLKPKGPDYFILESIPLAKE